MFKLKFLNHFIATYFSRDSLNQTLPLLSSLDSNDVNSKTLRQHLRLFFRERGRAKIHSYHFHAITCGENMMTLSAAPTQHLNKSRCSELVASSFTKFKYMLMLNGSSLLLLLFSCREDDIFSCVL